MIVCSPALNFDLEVGSAGPHEYARIEAATAEILIIMKDLSGNV
jgi:hypothetical protein